MFKKFIDNNHACTLFTIEFMKKPMGDVDSS